MKTKLKFSITVLLVLFSISTYSQAPNELYDFYRNDIPIDKFFNDKMLNIFFSNKIGTAFGGSSDLSLQKFYTSLDANDNSLSIGANYNNRGDDSTTKLSWLFSGGIKIKSDNKFATVYENGNFKKNDIGATFKITWIGRGTINIPNNSKTINFKETIKTNQKNLGKKYSKILNKFKSEELTDLNENNDKIRMYYPDIYENSDKLTKDKENELFVDMANEEVDFIEKNNLYSSFWNHWYSLELNVPFGENNYNITSDTLNIKPTKTKFYALNATFTANYMRQFTKGETVFLKLKVNAKKNNNLLVDNPSSLQYQTTALAASGDTVIKDSNDVYVTNYSQFWTGTITAEPALFTLHNTVGFSPALEFNIGYYHNINWKLGIPVSLKDSDGKPKVNFELQWKEVNTLTSSVHLVGISANFLFGELIN